MGPWCGQMGIGGWVGMAAFWVLVLALVIWAVSRLFPSQDALTPRAVLDARLASGDLDPETYRLIRQELDDLHDVATRQTR